MDLKKRFVKTNGKTRSTARVKKGDATFILAYYQSSIVQMYLETQINKVKQEFKDHDLTTEELGVIALRRTLKDKVIIGWENLKEDGVVLPYSPDEAERILLEYEGLDVEIMNDSLQLSNFKDEGIKEDKKKSKK